MPSLHSAFKVREHLAVRSPREPLLRRSAAGAHSGRAFEAGAVVGAVDGVPVKVTRGAPVRLAPDARPPEGPGPRAESPGSCRQERGNPRALSLPSHYVVGTLTTMSGTIPNSTGPRPATSSAC